MNRPDASLDGRIAALHAEGRLRVWSLAVTYFGDSARDGSPVAMTDLTAALGRLGAEPGAVRTAMSRLAKEGWLERERVGRRSFYRLSESAQAETAAAAARIYAEAPPEWDGGWTLALTAEPAPFASLAARGFRRIAPTVWIAAERDAAAGAAPREDLFLISGGTGAAPAWLRETLSPAPLAKRYRDFAAAWRGFEAPDDPLDRTAARTLLVHDWRRALLKDAALPRALRPEGWPGARARAVFRAAYGACEAADGSRSPTLAENAGVRSMRGG